MTAVATTFSDAVSRAPMRAFQWMTVAVCMLVLVSDGIDMQLLGILAPLVVHDFGVDRGTFGIAMSAALVGFGLGGWSGGWLGDTVGRRFSLALSALVFSLATIGASQAGGVWSLAIWRVLGGVGFGAAYSNSLAMASEWLPQRLRPVVVSTLSVGTPVGGAVVGWLGPDLAEVYGWRGTFVAFGAATLVLVVIVLGSLRDSPSFLLARGKPEHAARAARRVLAEHVDLTQEKHAGEGHASGETAVGVLHRSNLRLNLGVGLGFASAAMVAYGILNWSTTYLTSAGFSLDQASHALSLCGITSMFGSVAAGIFTRRFGSRRFVACLSATLLVLLIVLMIAVEALPPQPDAWERLPAVVLIATAGAVFSGAIATMYVVMVIGYPQSCRSAGIGFGIFMSRVGAVIASGFGGALLDVGHGSVVPFFVTLAVFAALLSGAVFLIDRHVPPARRLEPAPT